VVLTGMGVGRPPVSKECGGKAGSVNFSVPTVYIRPAFVCFSYELLQHVYNFIVSIYVSVCSIAIGFVVRLRMKLAHKFTT